jgi:hypothetical protein
MRRFEAGNKGFSAFSASHGFQFVIAHLILSPRDFFGAPQARLPIRSRGIHE